MQSDAFRRIAILDINTSQIKLYIYNTSNTNPTLESVKSVSTDLVGGIRARLMLSKEAIEKGSSVLADLYKQVEAQNISNIKIISTGIACLAENHNDLSIKLSKNIGKKVNICTQKHSGEVLLDTAIKSVAEIEKQIVDKQ